MPDIIHSRTIAASPEAIWPLLATSAGLASWWTIGKTMVTGDPTGTFLFESGTVVTELTATSLEPPTRLCWRCTGSNAPGGWQGTEIEFRLSRTNEGVRLDFAHRGFAVDNDGFRRVTAGWAQYFDQLKALAEGGANSN